MIIKGKNGLVTKIKLNNNSILEYKNGQWYKNGKVFTSYGLSKYKFYDPKKKSYMKLNKNGYAEPYTPYLDRLQNQELSKIEVLSKKRMSQFFKPSDKIITLKTKGRMNLADIPVNMLDSIAINTGRSRTNIKTNLGLVGKESTFGGMSKALGVHYNYSSIDPYHLVNNHAYYNIPEADYNRAISRKMGANNFSEQSKIDAEKDVKYAYEHGLIKSRIKHYYDNILADAFARYADNPKKYNPGQSNYTQMVTNIGNEVWNNPQIRKWWDEEGFKYYKKGLNE